MLPITGHEIQSAVPSNQAAARAPQRAGGESFADTMQRAQSAPEKHDAAASDADVAGKTAPSEDDDRAAEATPSSPGADADVTKEPGADGSGTQLASLVNGAQGEAALQHGKTAAGIGKPPHMEAKHDKHAAAKADEDAPAAPPGAAVADGSVAAGSAASSTALQSASAAAAPTSGGANTRGLRAAVADGTAQAGPSASSDKGGAPPALTMDASSTAAADDAAGKGRPHGAAEALRIEEGARVENAPAAGGVTVVHEMVRMEGRRDIHGSAGPAGGLSAAGSMARASAGDELNVYSYEAGAGNRLEIGVAGGSWGWLKVRAEMGQGGEVHAFLRGASAGAESELRAQAGDLQVYLGAQQVGVHTVHVEASRAESWTGGAGAGDGDREAMRQREQAPERTQAGTGTAVREELSNQWMPLPRGLHGAGGWLNVLA